MSLIERARRRLAGGGARRVFACALLLLLMLAAAAAYAQQYRYGRGYQRVRVREGMPDTRGGFTFCRLRYQSVRREPGGQGWTTDYPAADANFMLRLQQLTSADVSRWSDGQEGHAVVDPTSPELFQCPFLFASDVGTAGFSTPEAESLRQYLLKGGFLWVDDFWGNAAWAQWEYEIGRVLPEFPIVDLPLSHPLFAAGYTVTRLPQIPSIQFWRSNVGTSERGRESAEPHIRGMLDDTGRIVVLMTHNTDIADGWEREGENQEYFAEFSPDAYAVGINVVLWAMTH